MGVNNKKGASEISAKKLMYTGGLLCLVGLLILGFNVSWYAAAGVFILLIGNNIEQRGHIKQKCELREMLNGNT